MDIQRFLAEAKTRGVYRVSAIYAAACWALLQVADVIFPIVGFPQWAITLVLAVAALGFPVAVLLSWVFDITPGGIVETDTATIAHAGIHLSPLRLAEIGLILCLVFLVGFLYIDRLTPQSSSLPPLLDGERESIGVLPFVNISDAAELEYFGDGLAEEILNLLAGLEELNVAARTSSFYFKGRTDVNIQEIARHLGVRHVLEGSVRRQGNRVRVTAQLIDGSDGFHLWSKTFDRTFDDSFLIEDEIAQKVVEELQLILSDDSRNRLTQRQAPVPQAYDYYLQGREYLRGPFGLENLDQAEVLFSKAIALDTQYAAAYAGRCDSHLGHYRIERNPLRFNQAESDCQQALALGQQNTAVYVALGNLYRYSGKNALAIEQFENAIKDSPSSIDALNGLAKTYAANNNAQRAEKTFLRAIELQPNYWQGYQGMGAFLFAEGRFEEAIPYFQRITELMADNAEALNDLGASYFMLGQYELATQAWQESLTLAPTALAYSNAGASLFFLHRFEAAAEMFHKAVEFAPQDYQNWGSLGDAYRHSSELQDLAKPMYINAIRLATERLEVNPTEATTLALIAQFQASIGQREKALQNMARAGALAMDDFYVSYAAATTYCALNETLQAAEALDRALALGYSIELVALDANLCQLGQLPRFQLKISNP